MARAVLKPILPEGDLVDVGSLKRELLRVRDEQAQIMVRDFKRTTSTWTKQPNFVQVVIDGNDLIAAAGTDNRIYGYVTRGTRAHIIRPRRAKMLAFRVGYRAKTTPRTLGSRRGGASGAQVYAQLVLHPGTEARQFEEEIVRRRQKSFQRKVGAVIKRSIRRK